MHRRKTTVVLGVMAAATLLLSSAAEARQWTWYKNKAFDNAIEVPKDLFIKTAKTPDRWAELNAVSKDGFELIINAKTEPSWTIKQTADRMIARFGISPALFRHAKDGVNHGMQYSLYSYQGVIRGKQSWAVLMAGSNGPHRYALLLYTPLAQYQQNKAAMTRIANSIRPYAAAGR